MPQITLVYYTASLHLDHKFNCTGCLNGIFQHFAFTGPETRRLSF